MSNVSTENPVQVEAPSSKHRWQPVLAVVYVVLIFLASQILAGLAIGVLGLSLGYKADKVSDWLQNSAPAQFGFILLAEGLVIASVWLLAGRSRQGLKNLGIKRPNKDVLKKALLGFLAVYGLLIIVNIAVAQLLPQINTDQKQDIGFDHISTRSDVMLTFVSLVILPPLAEEILVRGFLYSRLRSRLRYVPTLLTSSLLFAAAHLQFGEGAPLLWSAAIDIFVLSLVLGYLREKTGNIWAGVLVHSFNNFVAFLVRFHGSIF